MIDRLEIEPFKNKYCRIGVPHDINPDKLFFYFGWIRYIDNTELKIEMEHGFRIIPLVKIMDIQVAPGGKHDFNNR